MQCAKCKKEAEYHDSHGGADILCWECATDGFDFEYTVQCPHCDLRIGI